MDQAMIGRRTTLLLLLTASTEVLAGQDRKATTDFWVRASADDGNGIAVTVEVQRDDYLSAGSGVVIENVPEIAGRVRHELHKCSLLECVPSTNVVLLRITSDPKSRTSPVRIEFQINGFIIDTKTLYGPYERGAWIRGSGTDAGRVSQRVKERLEDPHDPLLATLHEHTRIVDRVFFKSAHEAALPLPSSVLQLDDLRDARFLARELWNDEAFGVRPIFEKDIADISPVADIQKYRRGIWVELRDLKLAVPPQELATDDGLEIYLRRPRCIHAPDIDSTNRISPSAAVTQ